MNDITIDVKKHPASGVSTRLIIDIPYTQFLTTELPLDCGWCAVGWRCICPVDLAEKRNACNNRPAGCPLKKLKDNISVI